MAGVDELIGTYEGTGAWYDSTGKSSGYRVRQTMNPGGAFVEASYRASGEHLEVFGSSSRNAEGNYIAWTETLRRVGR